jgi:hypothetical protein
MSRASKVSKVVKTAAHFDLKRLLEPKESPKVGRALFSWTLDKILAARSAQMVGNFATPARLAEAMRTDDAIFVARQNRLAPSKCVKSDLVIPWGGGAYAQEARALFGQDGPALHPDTIADIHGTLVDHGVAFGRNNWEMTEDGSRFNVQHCAWPIDSVRRDDYRDTFLARFADGSEEPIVHGDGRWTIYRRNEIDPFKNGVIVPAALLWGRHAFALYDWAKSSKAHGNAKILGELPAGTPIQASDGSGLTAEAQALAELLQSLAEDLAIGILPSGAKATFLANASSAWQVFSELINNSEKAAARIYLGTDGVLGSQGGAPGVDVNALFGVASTLVEGDLRCLERGANEGVIAPWYAVNFGDSSKAARRVYQLPDPDQEAVKASLATRSAAFYADLSAARASGMVIDQKFVDALAADYRVRAPRVPVAS